MPAGLSFCVCVENLSQFIHLSLFSPVYPCLHLPIFLWYLLKNHFYYVRQWSIFKSFSLKFDVKPSKIFCLEGRLSGVQAEEPESEVPQIHVKLGRV